MIGLLAPSEADVVEIRPAAVENLPAAPVLTDEIVKVRQQINYAMADLERLDQRRRQAETVHAQLAQSNEELLALRNHREEKQKAVQNVADTKSQLKSAADSLGSQIAKMEADLVQQHQELTDKQAELEERKRPPPEPVNEIKPFGTNRSIDPVFIECQVDGIVIYETDDVQFIPVANLAGNAEFVGLLDRMAGSANGGVIFMVRSDAFPTYFAARSVARQHNCRNGKLPLVGYGEIDLQQVQRQLEESAE